MARSNRIGELFGFRVEPNQRTEPDQNESFVPENHDDGATVVSEGGTFGTYLDLEGAVRTEAELITRYREMALQPEVDSAIDDIVNEMIAYDADDDLVTINLDELEYSDQVKNRIRKEFKEVLDLFDFNNSAYDLCRRWYIDGRMYYNAIIDEEHPEYGLQEIRYIDPRKIRKVREIRRTKQGQATVVKTKAEYYIYNERGFAMKEQSVAGYTPATGIRIASDSIVHITSGLMDPTNTMVLGYLHKAIKPLNQLRALEDASVIYRLSRAPERRVFYIDVGSLPKAKAEQYLRDQMTKHKNKVVYDASSGEIRDDRKFMTMLEDFWLPRREGGRGTEITTLPGGQNLGEMTDVEYFQKQLYKALGVPVSRLQTEGGFGLGRPSEISRDEVKFGKFVDRLRLRFSYLFTKSLKTQLILKRVISKEESDDVFRRIKYDFQQDNYFSELKDAEIIANRLGLLEQIDPFVGRYYSSDYVKRKILHQDDEEIEEMKEQMDQDELNGFKSGIEAMNPTDPNDQQQPGGGSQFAGGAPNVDAAGGPTPQDDAAAGVPDAPTGGPVDNKSNGNG